MSIAPGQHITGIDIVLSAGTYIVGKVSDLRGAPIAGAQISARPEVGLPLDALSDADGMYRVGPLAGRLELVATAYGYVEAKRVVDVAPSSDPPPHAAASRRAASAGPRFLVVLIGR